MDISKTKEYDEKLHLSIYGIPKRGSYQELWKEILIEKGEEGLLSNAMKVYTNEGELTVVAPNICEAILKDHKNVSPDIYQELVDLIYISPQIARTKTGEKLKNSNSSFLVQTLKNHELTLTEKQKEFAVREALSMPGAILFSSYEAIEDSKIKNHGLTAFDIRYQILMNPNWSIEEKENLVYDFYKEDAYFDETIHTWEEEISKYYPNREQAQDIPEEITMYKLFHQMRPQKVAEGKKEEVVYQKK